jgi:cobalt-zinc-cadmium efflux system outer membrane protein
MTSQLIAAVLLATVAANTATAQVPAPLPASEFADRYLDLATGLTLERAIAQALEQEPGLRAERQDPEIARGARIQAEQRPNPSTTFDWRAEPGGTDRQTMIGVEWPLDLYRRASRIAVADRQVSLAELTVADRERVLSGQVREAYGTLLAEVRDLSLLDRLVALASRQVDVTRARVDEGASPPIERDLAFVELKRFEADRFLQAGRTEAASLRLRRLLGMQPGDTLRIPEPLDAVVRRLEQSVPASTDVGRRADVREAAEQIRLADAKIDFAERESRFDVSLFGGYSRMDAGFPQAGFAPGGGLERVRGQFHYFNAGVSIDLPLLDRRQGDQAAARAERTKADESLRALRLTAESEVATARTQLQFARQAVEQYADAIDTVAANNLDVVRQTYELGRTTILEVLNEQRRYLDAERGRTQALRAMFDAHTAVRLATGDVR